MPLGIKKGGKSSPCSDEEIRVFIVAKTASAFTLRDFRGSRSAAILPLQVS